MLGRVQTLIAGGPAQAAQGRLADMSATPLFGVSCMHSFVLQRNAMLACHAVLLCLLLMVMLLLPSHSLLNAFPQAQLCLPQRSAGIHALCKLPAMWLLLVQSCVYSPASDTTILYLLL
jgi:hypothetical protein